MAKQLILAVAFDDDKNIYSVDVPKGSSVQETVFAMSVVLRCFLRDEVIKTNQEAIELLTKYLNDEQYGEVGQ